MRLIKVISLYIIIMLNILILCSCNDNQDLLDINTRINSRYNDIKTCQYRVDMQVINNKITTEYEFNQFYKEPKMSKMILTSPKELAGVFTICNLDNVFTQNPNINSNINISDVNMSGDSFLLIPDFFRMYYKSEKTSMAFSKFNKNNCTILKTEMPGNNPYRYKESLWIENNTLLPLKIEVQDIKGNSTVIMKIYDFKVNIKIEDNLFDIES